MSSQANKDVVVCNVPSHLGSVELTRVFGTAGKSRNMHKTYRNLTWSHVGKVHFVNLQVMSGNSDTTTATVHFESEEEAENAVRLFHNHKLNGRTIDVSVRRTADLSSSEVDDTVPLQNVIGYVERLSRTMGVDLSPVLLKLSTDVKTSAALAADAGLDMKPILDVLIRDAFGEMKKVLDAEQGPDGIFAVQRDPSDVLRNHRSTCEKIERLYNEGNLSAIPLTEQSFQKQCLQDITECHSVWRVMHTDTIAPVADMEAVLARVRHASERKLDDGAEVNADQVIEATAKLAELTAATTHLESAQESLNLTWQLLTARSKPDTDSVFQLNMQTLVDPLKKVAERALKENEAIVRACEVRKRLVDSLKAVLLCGLESFLNAYREKVQERDSLRGHFRNGLLRLCVHGRSYYEHVLNRYVAELDKLHQALVRAEEDASQVNNPRRSQRGAAEKIVLLEDITDLGKRVDFANGAIEQLTAMIRECGGEEQACLVHHEADGRIRCLEALPADPFNANTITHDGRDIGNVLRQRLVLEEIASEGDMSEANMFTRNMSEADSSDAPFTERDRNYYVDERHINIGGGASRGPHRSFDVTLVDDAGEYNIVGGSH